MAKGSRGGKRSAYVKQNKLLTMDLDEAEKELSRREAYAESLLEKYAHDEQEARIKGYSYQQLSKAEQKKIDEGSKKYYQAREELNYVQAKKRELSQKRIKAQELKDYATVYTAKEKALYDKRQSLEKQKEKIDKAINNNKRRTSEEIAKYNSDIERRSRIQDKIREVERNQEWARADRIEENKPKRRGRTEQEVYSSTWLRQQKKNDRDVIRRVFGYDPVTKKWIN